MRVLLRAPLLSISGYGVHSRQVYEWLESVPNIDLTVDIVRWGVTTWNIDQNAQNGLIGRIMNHSRPIEGKYDLSFQVQLPDEWDSNLARKNIGISAFVETDRCNPLWIEKCNEMDAIIVPSTFTKTVAKRSGNLDVPIFVIPEWYNTHIDGNLEDLNLQCKDKFNFLMIGTITGRSAENDRKNLFYGIKWFCEQFKNNENVSLILKTCYGKGTTIDRKMTCDTVKKILEEVRVGEFPKIQILHGNMSEEEIASIYVSSGVKCLLSPTRGEGYGLPLVEAAASSLPVVATGWSGHTEFLKNGMYTKLKYTLKEINKDRVDDRIFMQGTRWAEIDERDFKQKIQSVVDNYGSCQKKAKNLKAHVTKSFCKKSVLKKYNDFLDELIR